jgi:nicotinamidase-related amidase
MTSLKHVHCLVAGCSLDETVLATVIDGFHRSHRFRVVIDAVTCSQPGIVDNDAYGASMLVAIGKFAGVELTSDLIEAAASEA